MASEEVIDQLLAMGFVRPHCELAMQQNGVDGVEAALSWMLENPFSEEEQLEADLRVLIEMGFDAELARTALRDAHGDKNAAIRKLVQGAAIAPLLRAAPDPPRDRHAAPAFRSASVGARRRQIRRRPPPLPREDAVIEDAASEDAVIEDAANEDADSRQNRGAIGRRLPASASPAAGDRQSRSASVSAGDNRRLRLIPPEAAGGLRASPYRRSLPEAAGGLHANSARFPPSPYGGSLLEALREGGAPRGHFGNEFEWKNGELAPAFEYDEKYGASNGDDNIRGNSELESTEERDDGNSELESAEERGDGNNELKSADEHVLGSRELETVDPPPAADRSESFLPINLPAMSVSMEKSSSSTEPAVSTSMESPLPGMVPASSTASQKSASSAEASERREPTSASAERREPCDASAPVLYGSKVSLKARGGSAPFHLVARTGGKDLDANAREVSDESTFTILSAENLDHRGPVHRGDFLVLLTADDCFVAVEADGSVNSNRKSELNMGSFSRWKVDVVRHGCPCVRASPSCPRAQTSNVFEASVITFHSSLATFLCAEKRGGGASAINCAMRLAQTHWRLLVQMRPVVEADRAPRAPAALWAQLAKNFRVAALRIREQQIRDFSARVEQKRRDIARRKAREAEQTCIVCWDERPNTVLVECGHICVCHICGPTIRDCPICREAVVRCVVIRR